MRNPKILINVKELTNGKNVVKGNEMLAILTVKSITGYQKAPKALLEDKDKSGKESTMKIIYDKVSSEYLYPLSKDGITQIKRVISAEDINKIRTIEFGCNTKTTQEGRTVQRGRFYDIRINFCLKNLCSLILSDEKTYLDQIKSFSGSVDQKTRLITWRLADAKRYSLFLLLHEIAHVIYSEHHSPSKLSGPSSKAEEQWCDSYAMQKIQELEVNSNCKCES